MVVRPCPTTGAAPVRAGECNQQVRGQLAQRRLNEPNRTARRAAEMERCWPCDRAEPHIFLNDKGKKLDGAPGLVARGFAPDSVR
jgi:hypothetical protein